jgi:hypothetical protein
MPAKEVYVYKIKDIGWIIKPERNDINDIITHYDLLSIEELKKLYDGLIVKDIDGKPDLDEIQRILGYDDIIATLYALD